MPAYVSVLAPLPKKRALAQMRLSGAPIQTNLGRGASAGPYSQRLCPGGCPAAVDSEQHVLFDECPATEAARARHWEDLDLCSVPSLTNRRFTGGSFFLGSGHLRHALPDAQGVPAEGCGRG
jgi:hypothetical protein